MTSAILYAAKSTEDSCGSIPTRLADWRAAAEAEGRDVVAQCSDESASAHKGNRGRGLERAMAPPNAPELSYGCSTATDWQGATASGPPQAAT